jgi:hypothetical protein
MARSSAVLTCPVTLTQHPTPVRFLEAINGVREAAKAGKAQPRIGTTIHAVAPLRLPTKS